MAFGLPIAGSKPTMSWGEAARCEGMFGGAGVVGLIAPRTRVGSDRASG